MNRTNVAQVLEPLNGYMFVFWRRDIEYWKRIPLKEAKEVVYQTEPSAQLECTCLRGLPAGNALGLIQ